MPYRAAHLVISRWHDGAVTPGWYACAAIAGLGVAACGRLQFERTGDAADSTSDGAFDGVDTGPRTVFVTSSVHDGSLGGLLAGDAICRARAAAARLPGTYKVWLADASMSPASRMTRPAGPYQLVTGEVVARGWDDLVDGMILAKINRTENGLLVAGSGCMPAGSICHFICEGGEVWSNVDAGGKRRSVVDCNQWTSTTATGTAGSTGETDVAWTEGRCTSITCQSQLPLFCVQQ
jgi:hypothetical protein